MTAPTPDRRDIVDSGPSALPADNTQPLVPTSSDCHIEMQQLLSLLEEKQRQVESLRQQVAQEREEFRRQSEAIRTQWEEVAAARSDVQAERERLREFRIRFVHRVRRQWRQTQQQTAAQKREIERQRRILEDERANWQKQVHEWQRQREAFCTERQQWLESARQTELRVQEQIEALARDSQNLREREAALREAERALELERDAWAKRLQDLRVESRGLEQRISAARRWLAVWGKPSFQPDRGTPPVFDTGGSRGSRDSLHELLAEVPLPHRPALAEYYERCQRLVAEQWSDLADQRRHLAELWERLTRAEEDWQNEQRLAILDMERLCGALRVEEEQLKARCRDMEAQAQELRTQREQLQRQRQRLEIDQAQWQREQIEVRAEAARRELEWRRRVDSLERREKSLDALFRRWRERRQSEVGRLRRAIEECIAARDAWSQARDEYVRRVESLRLSQQALAEQAIALEEVRQQLLRESTDPQATARRIESHRRRWEQAGKQTRRALEQFRRQLADEDATLRQIFLELEQQQEFLSRTEREINQRHSELEVRQRAIQRREEELASERAAWAGERDLLRQQIAELEAELERRLEKSREPDEGSASRAAA